MARKQAARESTPKDGDVSLDMAIRIFVDQSRAAKTKSKSVSK